MPTEEKVTELERQNCKVESLGNLFTFAGVLCWLIGFVAIIYFVQATVVHYDASYARWYAVLNITNGLLSIIVGCLLWVIASLIHLRIVIRKMLQKACEG